MKQENDLKKQLEKSVKLAHLELPPKEKTSLLSELEKILHFVKIIEKVDKKSNEELSEAETEFPQMKKNNETRVDKSFDFTNKEGLKNVIPRKKEELIKVKKI